jgi:hypothetical protein
VTATAVITMLEREHWRLWYPQTVVGRRFG